MVGSPSTYWLAGVIGLVLVSILTKVTLSPWALASSSMMGATCLHGPHQSAQKSTITGLSDLSTSSSNVESVTSLTAPICSLLSGSMIRFDDGGDRRHRATHSDADRLLQRRGLLGGVMDVRQVVLGVQGGR